MSSLALGEAWLWEPGGDPAIFRKIRIRERRTFNSSATPEPGKQRVEPRRLAPVDIEKFRKRMAATIERRKAEDPKELQKQIADLKRQLAAKPTTQPAAPAKVIEKPVLQPKLLARLEAATKAYGAAVDRSIAAVEAARVAHGEAIGPIYRALNAPLHGPITLPHTPNETPRPVAPSRHAAPARATGESLGRVHRAFLTVLANRQGKGTRRNQLAVFSGYSAKSRHVDNTISTLRSSGHIQGPGDSLVITEAGLAALGPWDQLPTGKALIDYWIREAGKAPGEMLRVLVDAYPRAMTRDEVACASGYSVTSRHVDNSLSYLRTLELIEGRGELRAAGELFE